MTNFFTALDLIGLLLLCFYSLQLLLAALLPRPRRSFPADRRLRFTFLIPALNEAQVIEATVRNLRLVAPDGRVAVIDDGSDDATAVLVSALAASDPGVLLLRRTAPEARQGKGKALNWAVTNLLHGLHAEGADLSREVFAVIDADGRLGPELLEEARQVLGDPQVMGAQARVRIRQSVERLRPGTVIGHMLEQQQDVEFFITRHLQVLRSHWHTVALCGNGQFMRASYVAEQFARGVAPWPDVLLEDFASGLEVRLARPTHRLAFLEHGITQQGLPDLRRFTRQRARWTQGTLQCLPYLGRLWTTRVPWLARLDFSYFILGPWLNLVIVLTLLTQPLRWATGTHGLILAPEVGLTVSLLNLALQLNWLVRYQLENRMTPGRVLFTVASFPVYGFALFLSLPLAFKNHFTGRRTWDKTARHAEPEGPARGQGVSAAPSGD
ncbi:glycosyl transferase family protein [Deinococcus phoenicis]|uniref:Glycosyl transferase family protein n=1 Tax=Deinococcus phoenicis TaxID=1476583 RepID=A0A016QSK2_9DEIO|nr:glycosyltransferase [Deinococcus phoenicis]EYB68779.1 glycosyl transferase family protein [Deinococcus phoenicis]